MARGFANSVRFLSLEALPPRLHRNHKLLESLLATDTLEKGVLLREQRLGFFCYNSLVPSITIEEMGSSVLRVTENQLDQPD